MRDIERPDVYFIAIVRLHRWCAALDKALLGRVVASSQVLEVGILNVAGLEKRVMVVRSWRITTVEHRVVHGRRLEFHESCLTRPVIARHGEELTRFALEAVLEMTSERLSNKICWTV